MLQIVLLLIGITIGSTYPLGIEPDVYDLRVSLAAVPALCLAYALVGAVIGRTYLRRFLQAREEPHALFASFLRCMTLYRALLLAVYAFQVYALLWPSCVAYDLRLGDVLLAGKLLTLLPLPLMLFLSWIPLYRLDRLLKGSEWSLRAYLVFQARLVIGPVLGIVVFLYLVDDGVRVLPGVAKFLARFPALELLLVLAMLVGLFLLSPLLLRLVWGGTPLPPGPLRDRLLALCDRAGIRVRDLLVWETFGGRFANSLVTGALPRLRYVFFTRPLLDGLQPEELEAVLAHELGHARHRHLVWYFAFAVGLILLVGGLEGLGDLAAGGASDGVLGFGLVAVYWSFLFLFASPRFERQADLFSLQLIGAGAPLASALLRVCALNGAPAGARSVTHGSIEERVLFLSRAQEDPAAVRQFERTLVPVRGAIGGILGAGLFLMTASLFIGWKGHAPDSALQAALQDYEKGLEAMEQKNYDLAAKLFRESNFLFPRDHAWRYAPYVELGNCEELRKNDVASREAFRMAYALYANLERQDPRFRVALRDQIRVLDDKINEAQ